MDNLLKRLEAINWRNLITRALWTFAQAFLAVILVSGETIIDLLFKADWVGLWTLMIATMVAGVAAGFSALKTLTLDLFREFKIWWRERGGI